MRIAISIWIFYKKLIIPTIVASIMMAFMPMLFSGAALTGPLPIHTIGVTYIVFTPFFQYFIYEIRNPEEYYFYYNMGLSKLLLWTTTIIISSIAGLIIELAIFLI